MTNTHEEYRPLPEVGVARLIEINNSRFGLDVTVINKNGKIAVYCQRNASERAEFDSWWAIIDEETKAKICSKMGIYKVAKQNDKPFICST